MSPRALFVSAAAVVLAALIGLVLLLGDDQDAGVGGRASVAGGGQASSTAALPTGGDDDTPAAALQAWQPEVERLAVAAAPGVARDAVLSGRVVGADGAPIAGATVALTPARVQGVAVFRTSSDAAGGFRFEDLPAGQTAVSARLDDGPLELLFVTLEPGACRDDVLLVLPRAASLSVTLIDALGDALPGRQLRLVRRSGVLDLGQAVSTALYTSDARGQVRAGALRADTYELQVDGWERREVALAEGQHVEVVLHSPLRQGLVGRVDGVDGLVRVVATSSATAAGREPDAAALSQAPAAGLDSRGRFELGLDEPGLYDVRAARVGGGQGPAQRVSVVPGALTEVVLSLPRGRLGGRLTWDHDGSPAVGRTVSVHADDGSPDMRCLTGPDGRWSLPNLGPGSYRVEVAGWRHPADRARDHVARFALTTLTLVDGEQRLDVDGTLCRGSGLTLGLTSAWDGFGTDLWLRVELAGRDGGHKPTRLAQVGTIGVFEELAAGAYTLSLTENAQGELLRELPVALGEHEQRELSLHLSVGELQSMQRAGERAGRVSGATLGVAERERPAATSWSQPLGGR